MITPNQLIESIFQDGSIDIQYAVDYAEPGYSIGDKSGILFANWNAESRWVDGKQTVTDNTMPRLSKIAEYAGYEIEWSDEWTTCSHCNKAVRTSPDCYGWKRSYYIDDCEVCCANCLDPAEYLASLDGKSNVANTFHHINPEDHGYILVKGEMENGFHPGQNDSPDVVAKSLRKLGIHRFVFSIDSVGQFDLRFSVYVHEEDLSVIPEDVDSALPYDPGIEIAKALRGEPSKVYRMESRELTREELVSGSWARKP